MKDFSLLNTRPLARPSVLPFSVLLHAALLSVLLLWPGDPASPGRHVTDIPRRSVILLQFPDTTPVYRRTSNPSRGEQSLASSAQTGSSSSASSGPYQSSMENRAASLADPGIRAHERHRNFELPTDVPVVVSRQTIVQLDIPPDISVRQDLPLPNVVLWAPQPLPPFRRKFVAPLLKQATQKLAQDLPPAPRIEVPNNEPTVADLKLASVLAIRRTLLVPPATTAPIRFRSPELAAEPPNIALPNTANDQLAVLIALSDSPARPTGIVIVPPANQASQAAGMAASGHGAGNSSGSRSGSRGDSRAPANGTEASVGGGASVGNGSDRPGARDGTALANVGNGAGGQGSDGSRDASSSDSGGAGNGTRGSGSGTSGSVGSGSGDGVGASFPGMTRIILPKDGKFGVVVTGSSPSVPYPESVGPLTGKTVYTVYLNVGLRRKWILQYCLAGESAAASPRGRVAALDAPWPLLMFRPDRLIPPTDYVIVHGLIDKDGRFDQLALIFPEEFEQKDLLINSLKLWAFRAASRDRVPTAIEVLLIIPGES